MIEIVDSEYDKIHAKWDALFLFGLFSYYLSRLKYQKLKHFN